MTVADLGGPEQYTYKVLIPIANFSTMTIADLPGPEQHRQVLLLCAHNAASDGSAAGDCHTV